MAKQLFINLGKVIVEGNKKTYEQIIKYGKVELVPPKLSELGEVKEGFSNLISSAKSGGWKNVTVKDAWLNSLITLEIISLFFVGEAIGRRHWFGYKLKY